MKQFNLKNKKIIFIVNPNSGKLSNKNKLKIISDCIPNNPDIFSRYLMSKTVFASDKAFEKFIRKGQLISYLKHKPKIVINLAAQAGVRYSLENPSAYIDTNIKGFTNILELSRKFKIRNRKNAN